jgi:6-phosphogluconate dehydrogenase
MVTSSAVDEILEKLIPLLSEGDVVIDGGNSFYKDTLRRGEEFAKKGIRFLDVGVSGGPEGARNGACLMIGGDEVAYNNLIPLFETSSASGAFEYMGDTGTGHYTKMVHNGIEYGMMQALAEGMNLLRTSDFNISLTKATEIYGKQSVITSRLVDWAHDGFEKYGEGLEGVKGSIDYTGEGQWTVDVAKEVGEEVPVIETALNFRIDSQENPSYTGRVVSMLRNMFGGHSIK